MNTGNPLVGRGDARQCLVCRVRHASVAIPIDRVAEIMRPLPVAPIAGMPAWVAGLAVVRGAATPVVDVGSLLHRDVEPAWRRFVRVVSGAQDRPLVLAVEAVLGVHWLADAVLRGLPGLIGEAGGDPIDAVGVHGRELLLILSTARVLPDAVWAALAEGAPA